MRTLAWVSSELPCPVNKVIYVPQFVYRRMPHTTEDNRVVRRHMRKATARYSRPTCWIVKAFPGMRQKTVAIYRYDQLIKTERFELVPTLEARQRR
jgi:hypothetical protein